jgi:hypothetical protein
LTLTPQPKRRTAMTELSVEERRQAREAAMERLKELGKKLDDARDELNAAVAQYVVGSFMDTELADAEPLPEGATVIGALDEEDRKGILRLNVLKGTLANAEMEVRATVLGALNAFRAIGEAATEAVWKRIAAKHGLELGREDVEYGTHPDGKGGAVVLSVPAEEDPFAELLKKMQEARAVGDEAA